MPREDRPGPPPGAWSGTPTHPISGLTYPGRGQEEHRQYPGSHTQENRTTSGAIHTRKTPRTLAATISEKLRGRTYEGNTIPYRPGPPQTNNPQPDLVLFVLQYLGKLIASA